MGKLGPETRVLPHREIRFVKKVEKPKWSNLM